VILRFLNQLFLRLFNVEIALKSSEKPWDGHFRSWIEKSVREGVDPNDLGDETWRNDRLDEIFERWYAPLIKPEYTVLELGPGSGRLTRRIVGKVRHLYVADYSRFVCDWMRKYLAGKGDFTVIDLSTGDLAVIRDASIDGLMAHGVFEHLSLYEMHGYLTRFSRILRPGAFVTFNYDNITSAGGREWFAETQRLYGKASPFYFYHPESIRNIAELAGFAYADGEVNDSRIAVMSLRWPGSSSDTTEMPTS